MYRFLNLYKSVRIASTLVPVSVIDFVVRTSVACNRCYLLLLQTLIFIMHVSTNIALFKNVFVILNACQWDVIERALFDMR